jgi:hypothetical protein
MRRSCDQENFNMDNGLEDYVLVLLQHYFCGLTEMFGRVHVVSKACWV